MYGNDDKKIYKTKLMIELELDSGVVLVGHVFVGQQQRLSDLMNDERTFLPFEGTDGSITIFHKSMARRICPLDERQVPVNDSDPHYILGITESASDAELREAYLRRVQANHPDRLSGLKISPELVRTAHEQMIRINNAYNTIRTQRRGELGEPRARAAE